MLALIDAIGPFFLFSPLGTTNWSKIPFSHLEKKGRLDPEKARKIEEYFVRFLDQVHEKGANAITLDDLAHLVIFPHYPANLRKKIRDYQELFGRLFEETKKRGMQIFINTDICFWHSSFADCGKDFRDILEESCQKAFRQFPIDGIIFRLGESDGNDVKGDFLSKLDIRTPEEANQFLKRILPLFEQNGKKCLVRTWTVGAHPIGDLAWNPKTYRSVFGDIVSKSLIVSMKYGESDFYRYASKTLSDLFFMGQHQKILEFQTRREREGFGMHPFYTGWEYESYLEQARKNPHFVGISVWCQTGGWSRQRDLTFLRDSSIWNELNTISLFQIFWHQKSASTAVDDFFHHPEIKIFLRKYRDIFVQLLYPQKTVRDCLYFRRLRLPPLLWIFWDEILINPLISSFYHQEKNEKILSRKEIKDLEDLGKKLQIPKISFQTETLVLFLIIRSLLAGKKRESDIPFLQNYSQKYPESYRVVFASSLESSVFLRLLLKIFLRKKSSYRFLDRILLSSGVMTFLVFWGKKLLAKNTPSFVNRQCMNIETVLIS